MNEEILSFIWRFQYFAKTNLVTDEGYPLSVLRPGLRNTNAGPDFSDARIRIDGVDWAGSVEIHTKSSDWFLHAHETDLSYETVILHVVWENDRPIRRNDGSIIPTLSLKGLVHLSILERYHQLLEGQSDIPCSASFGQVADIHKLTMLDRTLIERLDKKATLVTELLRENNHDWEETAYQWLTQHFGFKLNAPAFLRLSKILPLKTVLKQSNNLFQVEALLFGCAGLIPDTEVPDVDSHTQDNYITKLRHEFQFLQSKHRLPSMSQHEWKFLRLRPSGFPTVRLAQLAVLLCKSNGLFSAFIHSKDISQLRQLLALRQSDYWQNHYLFGKPSRKRVSFMGNDAMDLLIINAAVPLLVAYSKEREQPELLDKAIKWLSEIRSEDNQITRKWELLGMHVNSAADSQALIQWYHMYCTPKRCLQCAIGMALIRAN